MKNRVTKVLRMVWVALLLVLGLRACSIYNGVAIWHPPVSAPDVYRVSNASESLDYAFMPSGKLVVARSEGDHVCQWLGTVRGEYGHRVIWRLWYTPRPGWELLNHKIVGEGYTPVSFEDEVEARSGDACNGLAGPGETVYFVAEFSKNVMRIPGMELTRGTVDEVSQMQAIERAFSTADKVRK